MGSMGICLCVCVVFYWFGWCWGCNGIPSLSFTFYLVFCILWIWRLELTVVCTWYGTVISLCYL
ncbi:hypothetical protein BDV24DRAFT_134344 [Aspergillus arachidicola]|uniref:Uncharacterized protein n=1 Tax=Aspergillus arachidicola TaxID=656916 RepID=A0A5N6Y3W5_9EURO|nr:hypothetical protein BDV24DRAFT_134344 [Aspergillus arachidicola]